MSKDTGGPAFPVLHTIDGNWVRDPVKALSGMDLRDYFAAKAMQAAATNSDGANGFTFEQRAQWAYQQADAMLAERNK
jgi:hypothetical protein